MSLSLSASVRTHGYVIQQTPLQPHPSSQSPTQTVRGHYGPPSIRQWLQQQDPNPTHQAIAVERRNRQYNIHRDGQEFPAHVGNNFLHPHFCHNSEDQKLVFAEGVTDIKDTMTSMSRLADVLHIGFAIRPEWNTSEPLRPCNIHVETIASRQTQQLVGWDGIVAKLRNIIQEELGTAHIMQFQTKLRQVSPGPGYQIDAETRQAISHNVRLASSQLPTIAPKTPTASRVVPFSSATPNTSTLIPPLFLRVTTQAACVVVAPTTGPMVASPGEQSSAVRSVHAAPAVHTAPAVRATPAISVIPAVSVTPVLGISVVPAFSVTPAISVSPVVSVAPAFSVTPAVSIMAPDAGANMLLWHGQRSQQRPHGKSPVVPTTPLQPRQCIHFPSCMHPNPYVRGTGMAAPSNCGSSSTSDCAPPTPAVANTEHNVCRVAVPSLQVIDISSDEDDIINISTDEEDNAEEVNMAPGRTPAVLVAAQDAGWISTPPGTPPALPRSKGQSPPDEAPPSYYLTPSVASFDFAPLVAKFLRDIDVGPRALCRIDGIRDFEFSSWKGCFKDVGLTVEHAETLEALFLDCLTTEQGFVLLAAEGGSAPNAGTSVGTESSLADNE